LEQNRNNEASSHYIQQKNPTVDYYPAEVVQVIAPEKSGFKYNIILPHIFHPEYPKEIFHPPKGLKTSLISILISANRKYSG
jgi:hypothetical protein